MKLKMTQEKWYPFLTKEFFQKLDNVLLSKRVKIAYEKFQEDKMKLEEFRRKYYCEKTQGKHDFQLYEPFVGCAKLVCKNCYEESQDKLFKASVYALKGKSFGFKNKEIFKTIQKFQV